MYRALLSAVVWMQERTHKRGSTPRDVAGGGGKGTRMVDGAHFASRMANYVLSLKYATLKRLYSNERNKLPYRDPLSLLIGLASSTSANFPIDNGALLIVTTHHVFVPRGNPISQ